MKLRPDQQFEWDTLVPFLIHPMKVAIIEAMQWFGEPISPRELDRMFDEVYGVSLVAYHVRKLAAAGVLIRVKQQQVRGVVQSFYVLAPGKPAASALPS